MPFAPWLIVVVALLTLYGLLVLARYIYDWRLYVLMLIPLAIGGVYFWVWVSEPQLEAISRAVRPVLFYSFGIADAVIYTYIKRFQAAVNGR